MNLRLVTIVATLLSTTAFVQKDIPAFGIVDKSVLEMKSCDFDNAAEAVVLFDVGEVFAVSN